MSNLTWAEICARDKAWLAAQEQWAANGTHISLDLRLARCVVSGSQEFMTDDCWASLLLAHPQS